MKASATWKREKRAAAYTGKTAPQKAAATKAKRTASLLKGEVQETQVLPVGGQVI